jgi:hypothetical protein
MVDAFLDTDGPGDTLIAITDEAILIANPDPKVAPALASALAAGRTDLPEAKRVPFTALTSVRTNKHRSDLELRFWDGGATRSAAATFADAASRDRALGALEKRFGAVFKREDEQYGLARAVLIPLAWTVGMILFTFILIGAARELAGGASVPLRHAVRPSTGIAAVVLMLIGPLGAAVVGTLASVICLRWTITRWQQPPLMIRLVRR